MKEHINSRIRESATVEGCQNMINTCRENIFYHISSISVCDYVHQGRWLTVHIDIRIILYRLKLKKML